MILRLFFDKSGISGAEIARRLGHSNSGLVSQVITGKRTIPLDKLDAWTKALDLSEADAAEFRRLALAEQAPALAAELAELRRKVQELQSPKVTP